jgi:hypothetical protein
MQWSVAWHSWPSPSKPLATAERRAVDAVQAARYAHTVILDPEIAGAPRDRRTLVRPATLIALFAFFAVSTGCSSDSKTTDTRSSQFSSDREKLKFLSKYLVLHSNVEAAEFHITYHDNSSGLGVGPSDWDIRAVLKVKPQDTALWVAGMRRIEADTRETTPKDGLEWGYELLPKDPRWRVGGTPAVFTRDGLSVVVAIFAADGIVMKRAVAR